MADGQSLSSRGCGEAVVDVEQQPGDTIARNVDRSPTNGGLYERNPVVVDPWSCSSGVQSCGRRLLVADVFPHGRAQLRRSASPGAALR